MKKSISFFICCLLLGISILSFSSRTKIGNFENAEANSPLNAQREPQQFLLVAAAFALGFYNGYMDTKTDYGKDKEVLALNIYYDKKDFSNFDN